MKKLLCGIAVVGFMVTACSQPSVEQQFFAELEDRLSTLESLSEQDSVCISRLMEVSGGEDEELMALAEQMEAKHGAELPPEYEAQMEDLAVRTQEITMALMPKVDASC